MTRASNWALPISLRRLALIAWALSTPFALAGCETGGNIFGATGPDVAVAGPGVGARKSVAFAPIIGAPAQLSKQMETALVAEAARQQLTVVQTPGQTADYVIRGYVVAAPDAQGTELSYIWDVLDQGDKRVHRITGKDLIPGARQRDPWALVGPAAVQAVAEKTASQLAAFIPPAAPAPAATPLAPASAAIAQAPAPRSTTTPQVASAPTSLAPRNVSATTPAPAAQPAVGRTQVASATIGPVAAIVPPVTGAPGDGNNTLAVALQRQLAQNGIRTSAGGGAEAYTVKGTVNMGPPTAGQQSIRIEWQVIDSGGKKLGTVSQKNNVPQGSLNGAWGGTADAAAQAAVPGIVKLIPKNTATNG